MKYLLLLFFLSGCDAFLPKTLYDNEKLINYRCSPAHTEQVDKLYKICSLSNYTTNHCYLAAVAQVCEYKGPK